MRLSIVLMLFFTELVFAGVSKVGNGGLGIVCPNEEVLLIDYYEAETLDQLKINDSAMTQALSARISWLIDRVEVFSPRRAVLYEKWLEAFWKEAIFKKNTIFFDSNDSFHVVVRKGCKAETIIFQVKPLFSFSKRYFINSSLWSQMDVVNKAGLIFHELIYREMLIYGHDKSIGVRKYNSIIADKNFHSLISSEYLESLREFSIPEDYKEGP